MGREITTYFMNMHGDVSHHKSSDSIIGIEKNDHDTHVNPHYKAKIIDRASVIENIDKITQGRCLRECDAIRSATSDVTH